VETARDSDLRLVVFLAFANEQEGKDYLRKLPLESRELQELFQKAQDDGLCSLEHRSNATLDVISNVFARRGRHVAIFHYGGHAGPDRVFLESDSGQAHAVGLTAFLGLQEGLRIVFLNGCSTSPQATALLAAGIDAVVATGRQIRDETARSFAVEFYTWLVAGRTLRDSFKLATARVKPERPGDVRELTLNGVFDSRDIADDNGFPWKLFVRDGAEPIEQETLARMAGKPLLALPSLPPVASLPPTPYRGLERFTRKEAHLFFGRAREIADLYHRVTSLTTRPVILLSGPTGAGKSSMLDAGLTPRLEQSHEVAYLRRDIASGLLGTLLAALTSPELGSQPDLATVWSARENSNRPLIVILDQAEEVFTRPREKVPAHEVAELLEALQILFGDHIHRPRGRLILSFRKEWLHEMERAFDDFEPGYEPFLLSPLNRDGLIDAIEGPARDPELRRFYRLTVENRLADRMATELAADASSAVAPVLQVLLTKLWLEAGGKGARFTSESYDLFRKKGVLLDDVIDEGLLALRNWRPDIVDSGFSLDLLEYHTTDLATAETRSRAELSARYPHRADVLEECLRLCEEAYMLIPGERPAQEGSTNSSDSRSATPLVRLGHDLLAPLIQKRFRESRAPGQKARGILETRVPHWKDGDRQKPLDAADLTIVEAGAAGMRARTSDEERLVAASQQSRKEKRRQGIMALVTIFSLGFIAILATVLTVASFWQAADNGRKAQQRLAASYVRGIGQSASLTPTEVGTLRALAREDDAEVRYSFFEQALSSPATARQLRARYQAAVHCGVRFDAELRGRSHKLVLKTLDRSLASRPAEDFDIALAATLVGLEIGSDRLAENDRFCTQAMTVLTDARSRIIFDDLPYDALGLVAAGLPIEHSDDAAARVVALLAEAAKVDQYVDPKRAWEILAPKLSAKGALTAVMHAIEHIPGAEHRAHALIEAIEALADRLSTNGAQVAALRALDVIVSPSPDQLEGEKRLWQALGSKPSTEGAQAVAARILALIPEAGPFQLEALTFALTTLPQAVTDKGYQASAARARQLIVAAPPLRMSEELVERRVLPEVPDALTRAVAMLPDNLRLSPCSLALEHLVLNESAYSNDSPEKDLVGLSRRVEAIRGYPVIFSCNFGYLNGGCFKVLGFNLLSI
jgi:hypothetical protein